MCWGGTITNVAEKMLGGIKKNRNTVCSFIEVAALHDGRINPRNLFRVKNDTLEVELAKTAKAEMKSLIIGIEPCNSYSPIYELDYFLMAFFLSSVATTLPMPDYAGIQSREERMMRIMADIERIGSVEMLNC